MNTAVLQAAQGLEELVSGVWAELESVDERAARFRPYPGAWSAQEILGHLIDSASNNHQRFVRLALIPDLVFPGYQPDNEAWVRVQRYNELPWSLVLDLWRAFNLHLSGLMRGLDPDCRDHLWVDGAVRLEELMVDYVRHQALHVAELRERLAAGKAAVPADDNKESYRV